MPKSNITIYEAYLTQFIEKPNKINFNKLLKIIIFPDYKKRIAELIKTIHGYPDNMAITQLIMQLTAETDPQKFDSVHNPIIPGVYSRITPGHIFTYLIETLGKTFNIAYKNTSYENRPHLSDLFNISSLTLAFRLIFIITLGLLISGMLGKANAMQIPRSSKNNNQNLSDEDWDKPNSYEASELSYLQPVTSLQSEFFNELQQDIFPHKELNLSRDVSLAAHKKNVDNAMYEIASRQYKYWLSQGDKQFKQALYAAQVISGVDALTIVNHTEWFMDLMKLEYVESLAYLLKTLNVNIHSYCTYLTPNITFLDRDQDFSSDEIMRAGLIEVKYNIDNTLIIKVSTPQDVKKISVQNLKLTLQDKKRAKQEIMTYLIDTNVIAENSSFFPSVFYYALSYSSLEMIKCIDEHSNFINTVPVYSDTKAGNLRDNYFEFDLIWSALMVQNRPEVIEYIFMKNPSLGINKLYNAQILYNNLRSAWSPEIMERSLNAFINYLGINDAIVFNPKIRLKNNIQTQASLLFLASLHNDDILLKVLLKNEEIRSRLMETPYWLNELNEAIINFANNENENALSTIFSVYNAHYLMYKVANIFDKKLSSIGFVTLAKATGYALLGASGLILVLPLLTLGIVRKIFEYHQNNKKNNLKKMIEQFSEILKPFDAICQSDGDEFKIIFKGKEKALLSVFFDKSVKRKKQQTIEFDLSEFTQTLKEKVNGVFAFESFPPALIIKKSRHPAQVINQLQGSLQELLNQCECKEVMKNRLLTIMKKVNASTKIEVVDNKINYIIGLYNSTIALTNSNELFSVDEFIISILSSSEILTNDSIKLNKNSLTFTFLSENLNHDFLNQLERELGKTITTLQAEKKQKIANREKIVKESESKKIAQLKIIQMSNTLATELKKINKDIMLEEHGDIARIVFKKNSMLIKEIKIDDDEFMTELKNKSKSINAIHVSQSDDMNIFSFPCTSLNQSFIESVKLLWSTTTNALVKKYQKNKEVEMKNKFKKLLPILSEMLLDFNSEVDCKEEDGEVIITLTKKIKNVPPRSLPDFYKKLTSKLIGLGLRRVLVESKKFFIIPLSGDLLDEDFIEKFKIAILNSIKETTIQLETVNNELIQNKEQEKLKIQQNLMVKKAKLKEKLINQLKNDFYVEERGDMICLRFSQSGYLDLSKPNKKLISDFLSDKFKKLLFHANDLNIEIKFSTDLLSKNVVKTLNEVLGLSKSKISELHTVWLRSNEKNSNQNFNQISSQMIVTKSNAKKTISDYFSLRTERIKKEIDALEMLAKVDYLNMEKLNATYFHTNQPINLSYIDKIYLFKIHASAILYHLAMFFDKAVIDINEKNKIHKHNIQFFDKIRAYRNALIHLNNTDNAVMSNLIRELRGDYYVLSIGEIGCLSSATYKIEIEFTTKNNISGIHSRVYHADVNSIEDFFFDSTTELYADAYMLYKAKQPISDHIQYCFKEKVLANTKNECRKKSLLKNMKDILVSLTDGETPDETILDASSLSGLDPIPPKINREHLPAILKQLQETFSLIVYSYRQQPDENSMQFQPWLAAINKLMLTIRDRLQRLREAKKQDSEIKYCYGKLINSTQRNSNNNNNKENNVMLRLYNLTNWYISHTENVETIEDNHKDSINETLAILDGISRSIDAINKCINELKPPLASSQYCRSKYYKQLSVFSKEKNNVFKTQAQTIFKQPLFHNTKNNNLPVSSVITYEKPSYPGVSSNLFLPSSQIDASKPASDDINNNLMPSSM